MYKLASSNSTIIEKEAAHVAKQKLIIQRLREKLLMEVPSNKRIP